LIFADPKSMVLSKRFFPERRRPSKLVVSAEERDHTDEPSLVPRNQSFFFFFSYAPAPSATRKNRMVACPALCIRAGETALRLINLFCMEISSSTIGPKQYELHIP